MFAYKIQLDKEEGRLSLLICVYACTVLERKKKGNRRRLQFFVSGSVEFEFEKTRLVRAVLVVVGTGTSGVSVVFLSRIALPVQTNQKRFECKG